MPVNPATQKGGSRGRPFFVLDEGKGRPEGRPLRCRHYVAVTRLGSICHGASDVLIDIRFMNFTGMPSSVAGWYCHFAAAASTSLS